jgi:SAM-dependent methyltransferase
MQANTYSKTAQFYDLVLNMHNSPVAEDIEFYKKIIPPKSRVLEIGCGTGRVAIELYRHGCFITGVDLSEAMLAEFDKKLRLFPDMRSRITLHLADMTTFDLKITFDWVIFPFRVFQALKEAGERRACLLTVRRHMGANSRAVITMFNPIPDVLASWGKKGILDFDLELPGSKRRLRRIQNQISHDAKAQIFTTEHIYQVYDDQGVLEEYPDHLELGYLYPEQAEELFVSSGFFIEHVYADYSFQPLEQDVKKEQIYILRSTTG